MYKDMIGILFILLLMIVLFWFTEYYKIELYDTIYVGPNNELVVVIHKNLFAITISYIGYNPRTISFLTFIIKYKLQ